MNQLHDTERYFDLISVKFYLYFLFIMNAYQFISVTINFDKKKIKKKKTRNRYTFLLDKLYE